MRTDDNTENKDLAHDYSEAELLQELQAAKVELEMQNEKLRHTQSLLEASRNEYHNRFVELYDFVPVGYVVLNNENLITEANLTAASMLNAERNDLIHQHFPDWIAEKSVDSWQQHFLCLKQNPGRQRCELLMQRKDGSTFYVQIDGEFIKSNGRAIAGKRKTFTFKSVQWSHRYLGS